MALYRCTVCDYIYDENREGNRLNDLPDDWVCPICESGKAYFEPAKAEKSSEDTVPGNVKVEEKPGREFARASDDLETTMADIHTMAATGRSVIEPMRTKKQVVSWDDILIKGAQLARIPLNESEPVNTVTIIGPRSAHPLEIAMPLYVSHMSFGALSREVKTALAKGSAAMETAICSGEGGILPDEMASAYKYIFEYVPNRYSVTDENLRKADAIEIKVGQSSKPGMGGHLPGGKVTDEISAIRGFPPGKDIISPAHFEDIRSAEQLKEKVDWLRERSGGKPIGVKIAAGHIEADLKIIVAAWPDFITIDGRPGGTGASPKYIKAATSVPTLFALYRARKFLDSNSASHISLIITGGLRVSSDFAKALALGADAIAIATAAMISCGCQQYRACHTGKCPVGIATQDPELRARFDIDKAAQGLKNYLEVCTAELRDFARLTGHDNVHHLSINDLATTNSEIANYTEIEHV